MYPISFMIITAGDADDRINEIVDSIHAMTALPPKFEIKIIGGETSTVNRSNTEHIPFDETIKPGWITRKKNIATDIASFEHIVYLHDYHVFDADWYTNMCAFGWDWDIQVHQILMINGVRMFDWVVYDHPEAPRYCPVPYERTDLIPYQYISGGYWVATRTVMQEEPQNEELGHHQAEDLDWSFRVRNKYRITMNPACIVRHNKPHRENELQRQRMIHDAKFFS